MYSDLHSRAGLVALAFALIFSLVSAVPIPTLPVPSSEYSSTLSSRGNRNGPHLIHRHRTNTGRIAQVSLNGPLSDSTFSGEALTSNNNPTENENQLVRRNAHLNAKIRAAFHNLGHKMGNFFHKVGAGIKKAAQTVWHGVKTAAQRVATGVKKAAQTVWHGVKTAAKKVATFVKTTGAKIAKFGLEVVSTVASAVGKVLSFIPAVGKPIDRALEGVSKVTGLISDKIHAKLGSKLQKGMNIMKKADKIMGYIPRRRDLSEVDSAFQERDISDAYRDAPYLEH